jgi:hypothetical protein
VLRFVGQEEVTMAVIGSDQNLSPSPFSGSRGSILQRIGGALTKPLKRGPPKGLTVNDFARRFNFPRRLRGEAQNSILHGLPIRPNATQIEARQLRDSKRAEIFAWQDDRLRACQRRLEATGAPPEQNPFEAMILSCERRLSTVRDDFAADYAEAERIAQLAERARDKKAFELGRVAPRIFKPTLQLLAGSASVIAVEAAVGSAFYAKLTDYGPVGGAALAAVFTLPLVVATFLALGPRTGQATWLGRLGSLSLLLLAVTYSLLIAHFRALNGDDAKAASTMLDAAQSLIGNPAGFLMSTEATVLAILQAVMMIWTGAKAPAVFDELFGLSMMAKEAAAHREAATAEYQNHRDEVLPEIQDSGCEEVRSARKQLQVFITKGLLLASDAVDDTSAARQEQRVTDLGYAQFVERLETELAQGGAPNTSGANLPAISTGESERDLSGANAWKQSLLQYSADVVDDASAAEADIKRLVGRSLLDLPSLKAKIAADVATELSIPPYRKSSPPGAVSKTP